MAFLYLVGAFGCFFIAFGISWAQDSSYDDGCISEHMADPDSPFGSFVILVKTLLFGAGGLYCVVMLLKELVR